MLNFLKNKYNTIYFVLGVFSIPGIFLLSKGALSTNDEGRYLRAFNGLKALIETGSLKDFFSEITINAAIPGCQLLRLIPASVQYFLEHFFHISHLNPDSLAIPQFFNLTVILLSAYFFYRIIQILFNNDIIISLTGTVIYVSLVNTNLFIRHLLPPPLAILFVFVTLFYFLKNSGNMTGKKHFITGILTLFTFSTYTGFYFFPVIVVSLLYFPNLKKLFSEEFILKIFLFFSGIGALVVIYELMSRIGKTSYIVSNIQHSNTIDLGDYFQGFSFLPEYLLNVEGITGIAIMICVIFSVSLLISKLIKIRFRISLLNMIEVILLLSFTGILLHASLTYFFHKMVWYGRLLHFYFPFLTLSVLYCISLINKVRLKQTLIGVVIMISVVSYVRFYSEYYNSINYPKDVLFKQKIDLDKINDKNEFNLVNFNNVVYSPPYKTDGTPYYSEDSNYVTMNFTTFWPDYYRTKLYNSMDTGSNCVLIYSGKHFQQFSPYLYEGLTKVQRDIIDSNDISIKIYKIILPSD